MAKLTVWLHQGTSIPSGHQQTNLSAAFTSSDGRLINDGWYEFLGSEAVIKTDYKSVTGHAIDSFPQESSSSIGEGNYFGGTDGDPAGE